MPKTLYADGSVSHDVSGASCSVLLAPTGPPAKGPKALTKLPKVKCCTSKPKCQRCPLRMLADGSLPDGYAVKKRRLIGPDGSPMSKAAMKKAGKELKRAKKAGKAAKKAGKQAKKAGRLPEAA
ncbi:MAG TPA: hypothetical protein VH419_10030 [Nocardioidaceae bacterium]